MIYSSSTIFTARRLARAAATLLAASALGLMPVSIHAEPEPAVALIAAARRALVKGDGIDAEMKLREVLQRGVPPHQIAAFLGAAYLRQGDRTQARKWLGPARFSQDTAAEGLRVLAQLEQQEGNLAAADRAYKRALAITPRDVDLRVEIGRLRYRQGEHLQAIRIADHAIRLDPRNVRAIEFGGQLVRDRFGLLAALPWFETALMRAPADVSVLGHYAATLGEIGRASEMLVVTRRMLQLSPGNPQAYYLQAVLAARAGRYDLARGLLARTRGKLADSSGAMLLEAVLEFTAGNMGTAGELCETLLKRQPDNMRIRELLARTLYLSGQYRYLTLRFRGDIARGDASSYLLSVVARAHESQGEREQAGALLDRAAVPEQADLRVVPQASAAGALMGQGRSADALASAERDRIATPGSYQAQAVAGDVLLAMGRGAEAQRRYVAAAHIRMSDSLLLRRYQAYQVAGDLQRAKQMVGAWLTQNPGNRTGLRLQAMLAVQSGDWSHGAEILSYLSRSGSGRDVQVLTDLALLHLRSGRPLAAEHAAMRAYGLQRASPLAAQALALSYVALRVKPAGASALIDKAQQMLGDNPVLAEARQRLSHERPPVLPTAGD
jgi:tetratricopeptide (TPR) repeat protein